MMGIPDIGESKQIDLNLDEFEGIHSDPGGEPRVPGISASGSIDIPRPPGASASGSIDIPIRNPSEERVPLASRASSLSAADDGFSLESEISAVVEPRRRRALWAMGGLLVATGAIAALWLAAGEPQGSNDPPNDARSLTPASALEPSPFRSSAQDPGASGAPDEDPLGEPPTRETAPVGWSAPVDESGTVTPGSSLEQPARTRRRAAKKRKRNRRRNTSAAEARVRPASRMPHTPTAVPYPESRPLPH